jgi:hypothetical protein
MPSGEARPAISIYKHWPTCGSAELQQQQMVANAMAPLLGALEQPFNLGRGSTKAAAGCRSAAPTRRVGRALASMFGRGGVSKDTVSRAWRKIKRDWQAWNKHDLSSEDMAQAIADAPAPS